MSDITKDLRIKQYILRKLLWHKSVLWEDLAKGAHPADRNEIMSTVHTLMKAGFIVIIPKSGSKRVYINKNRLPEIKGMLEGTSAPTI